MSSKIGITNIFYDLREVRIVNELRLKPIHKLVLYVLESRGNDIRPKKSTIAEDCGCSKATIDKAIKDLVKVDLIRVKRRFNSSNRYFINKEAFHKVAQELHIEASIKKSIEAQVDDPDYDPWEEEATLELENEREYVDNEIGDITRIKNEQALSTMWEKLKSGSSQ